MIEPHSRLVISTQELENGITVLVVERIGNGLNNSADTITIVAPDGAVIDEVQYGDEALPAPDRGLSIALEPSRWVVTAEPTPGSAGVTPLLGDAFRSASIREPVSDDQRLTVVEASDQNSSDAWMIVSFALIGVILTLVVRRWRPDEAVAEQERRSTTYSGPTRTQPLPDEAERGDENLER